MRVLTFSLHLSQCLHSSEPKPTCFDLCLSVSADSLLGFDNVPNDSSRKLSSGTLAGNKVRRPIRVPQVLVIRFEVSNDQCIEANGTVSTIFRKHLLFAVAKASYGFITAGGNSWSFVNLTSVNELTLHPSKVYPAVIEFSMIK